MNRTLVPFAAIVALLGAPPAIAAPPTPPPHTIPDSQIRVLPRNEAGRHYQLHVGLPASYAKEPSRRYPVVYVTDGYWDFAKMTTIHGSLVYDRVVPEFVTVGIGYADESPDYGQLRRWELSPVPLDDGGQASGHAGDFLKTIETVIIPFVEKEYRVDPSYRVLAGASLGGLFTLYSMYTKPGLFQAYVAATPAVVVGNDWLLGYEDAFAKSGKSLAVTASRHRGRQRVARVPRRHPAAQPANRVPQAPGPRVRVPHHRRRAARGHAAGGLHARAAVRVRADRAGGGAVHPAVRGPGRSV